MSWYLCGVFDGPVTGQIQTLHAIKCILKEKCDLKIINMPSSGILFPFRWIAYIFINFICLLKKENRNFYIVFNRTKISFWTRDLPVFLIARFKKAEIVCHLVGSDIENFIKSLNFLEKHIMVFCLHGIKRWVVLGDNMKNQIINVYKYLNIQEKLDIDFIVAEGFISEELNGHVKNEMIEKKVATFGNSLNIGYMSNLIEDKGIIIFIEAIIYIKEVLGHDIRAWIAGDYIGTPSKKVANAMKKVKTKNYINYVGVIRDKQKWNKLLETDLFILPTYYKTEALPLSIVEAMRCGCLCISSKIGEIDELLSSQKGITLNDVDTESLIENINNCCVDLHKFKPIIINAVTYAKKEFSFSSYKNKILSAIH